SIEDRKELETKKGAGVYPPTPIQQISRSTSTKSALSLISSALSLLGNLRFFGLRYRQTNAIRSRGQVLFIGSGGSDLMDQSAAGFLREDQFVIAAAQIDLHEIA